MSSKLNANDKRLTVKDIAAMAHVSTGTVDRVLHQRGEVSEKTRKKILQIVEQSGYEKDILASTLASKKIFKIVTLLPSSSQEIHYWDLPPIGIKKAFNEIKHFGIEVHSLTFNYHNTKDFIKQSAKVLDANPDGVLIAPVLQHETDLFIKNCIARNIAVAAIDTYIKEPDLLTYIGQNSSDTGMLAARLMHYGMKGKNNYLIVNISQRRDSYTQLRERAKGFKNYFKNNHINAVIHEMDIENNEMSSVIKNIEPFFNKTEAQGIFVSNSRVYKIASYLEKKKINHIRLIGYDLLEENISFLKKGHIDFLISQKPEVQAYEGIMSLFNYLVLKKDVEKIQYLPIDIIIKENIDYYKF